MYFGRLMETFPPFFLSTAFPIEIYLPHQAEIFLVFKLVPFHVLSELGLFFRLCWDSASNPPYRIDVPAEGTFAILKLK